MSNPTDAKEVVERLRKNVLRAEDGAGTLPAKEAVKLRPADWHAVTKIAREAATLIEAQAADLAREREELRQVRQAFGSMCAERDDLKSKLTSAEQENAKLRARVSEWRGMDSAPKDGKHCILSIQEGAFFWSVQGAFHDRQWNCVHRANVEPLAWMPNVLLPDEFCARSTLGGTDVSHA